MANMSPANRDKLRKKLTYYPSMKQVGGYILPTEAIYIIEKFKIKNHSWGSWSRDKIKKGESIPTWYYFSIPQNAIEEI